METCTNEIKENCSHEIHLNNVEDGAAFCYTLLIIKGHITNKTNQHITVSNNRSKELTQSKLKENNFKIIIDLQYGENTLTISYCCSSIKLSLNYEAHATDLVVVPVYIICKADDGKFQAPHSENNSPENALKRIIIGCKLIQSLISEKLNELGFGRKTFQLGDSVTFNSKLGAEDVYKMKQKALWYYFAHEIMTSDIGSTNKKYLAFLSCTKYEGNGMSGTKNYEELLTLTKGYVAYGGDHLALLGTACLYTWAQEISEIQSRFEDESPVNRDCFMDDSCYRGTLGGCFSTTLGAALHELCHTFELGHTENGIMARGFDHIQNVFLPTPEGKDFKAQKMIPLVDVNKIGRNDVHWTTSCILILYYNKWLNSYKCRSKYILHYDKNSNLIKSTEGLRVIELRRVDDEMVVKSWVFYKKVLTFSHKLYIESLTKDCNILFVMDNVGNILKENL